MTQPPLGVNQSVVVLKKERQGGKKKNWKKRKKEGLINADLWKREEDGKKEEGVLSTLLNRQDQYTFRSPVTKAHGAIQEHDL
jgi:peptide deformylase